MSTPAKPMALPPQVVCRNCGMRHYSPVCCPICKEQTPHYVVLKGKAA